MLGSVNLDTLSRVQAFPQPGETVRALSASRGLGGKGANQAVAARRAGAQVSLIAALGTDTESDFAADQITRAGVDVTALLRTTDHPCGTATVILDAAGENCIVVDSGANAAMTAQAVRGPVKSSPRRPSASSSARSQPRASSRGWAWPSKRERAAS